MDCWTQCVSCGRSITIVKSRFLAILSPLCNKFPIERTYSPFGPTGQLPYIRIG